MTGIAAICTDGDGTLWDTEEMLFRVYRELVAERGHHFTEDDYRAIVGQGALQAARIVIGRFGLPETPEAFRELRRARTVGRHREAKAMPGAETFLETGAAAGLPIALVSSAVESHVSMMLDLTGFRRFFRTVITSDTEGLDGRYKPDPEPYLMAARRLGAEPSRCLAVEDTRHGAVSARAAGMIVVAAPHRFSPREAFTPDLAHHVIPEGKTLGDLDFSEVARLLPP